MGYVVRLSSTSALLIGLHSFCEKIFDNLLQVLHHTKSLLPAAWSFQIQKIESMRSFSVSTSFCCTHGTEHRSETWVVERREVIAPAPCVLDLLYQNSSLAN